MRLRETRRREHNDVAVSGSRERGPVPDYGTSNGATAAGFDPSRAVFALRMDGDGMRRDESGAVRDYSWRRLNLPGAVFEVRGSTRRYRHCGQPVEVTLRPCGSMRYATDNGRALPLYVVRALEEAATASDDRITTTQGRDK